MPIKNTSKALLLVLLLGATLVYLISMDNHQRLLQSSWKQDIPLMGTTISVTIRGVSKEVAQIAFVKSFEIAQEIDDRISTYKSTSEISTLNAHFKHEDTPITLSPKTAALVKTCLMYTSVTNGAFDITVRPLIELWRTAKKTKKLPSPEDILRLKPQGLCNGMHLDGTTLSAPRGTNVDFGGIGKGYTGDLIANALEELGIYNYLIDVGRDLVVCGKDAPWRIGIQHPLKKNKAIQTIIVRKKIAIATSGDYEQQYTIGPHTFTHIINPQTGWPIKKIAGATIIAPTGTEADALATAFTILSPSASLEVADSLTGVEVLILQHNKNDLITYHSKKWPEKGVLP